MRVLIDTNIILYIVLNRAEFFDISSSVLKLAREQKICGFITATSLTNIHYIVRKERKSAEAALTAVNRTLEWCKVAPVNHRVLDAARHSGMLDFEDAVQATAAKDVGIDTVVTRDKLGFLNSGLQVYSPEEFLQTLK
jgi:predicted nucleic acid-binding protein